MRSYSMMDSTFYYGLFLSCWYDVRYILRHAVYLWCVLSWNLLQARLPHMWVVCKGCQKFVDMPSYDAMLMISCYHVMMRLYVLWYTDIMLWMLLSYDMFYLSYCYILFCSIIVITLNANAWYLKIDSMMLKVNVSS